MQQDDSDSAVILAGEAYNPAVIAFNSVHIIVQEAAGTVVDCLNRTADLCKAETYAQMSFDRIQYKRSCKQCRPRR
jgi:hypothetical protein